MLTFLKYRGRDQKNMCLVRFHAVPFDFEITRKKNSRVCSLHFCFLEHSKNYQFRFLNIFVRRFSAFFRGVCVRVNVPSHNCPNRANYVRVTESVSRNTRAIFFHCYKGQDEWGRRVPTHADVDVSSIYMLYQKKKLNTMIISST